MYFYAERYLREIWPAATKALKEVGIGCELNLVSKHYLS
jgi:ribosomal RNA assembly protein